MVSSLKGKASDFWRNLGEEEGTIWLLVGECCFGRRAGSGTIEEGSAESGGCFDGHFCIGFWAWLLVLNWVLIIFT